jgi:serine/threonine protein kinase
VIVHRDLKPSNLVVDENWNVKVADFGFARIKEENATMTRCGTPCWTAPEIIRGEKYDERADVYTSPTQQGDAQVLARFGRQATGHRGRYGLLRSDRSPPGLTTFLRVHSSRTVNFPTMHHQVPGHQPTNRRTRRKRNEEKEKEVCGFRSGDMAEISSQRE